MSRQSHQKTISNFSRASIALAGLTMLSLVAVSAASAAQPTVNLGTTKDFAVLAGSGITNTGPTTLSGTAGADIGSSPNGSFSGSVSVTTTGTKYLADDPAVQDAKDDLIIAYNDAAGRTPAATVSADLGGQTLTEGVYKSASSLGLTGTLILDGENDPDAVFIFQAGSTLTTASGSTVRLINGAQPCNVFWQVGSSATFGTSTDFVGHVLALTSITANTGASFEGQLLARNGAVTLDTNTITNDLCEESVTPTPTPTDSPTATPTATPTPTTTPTPTPTDSPTSTPTPTDSPTSTPTATPSPDGTTSPGGELPNTETVDWTLPFTAGTALVLLGTAVLLIRRRVRS